MNDFDNQPDAIVKLDADATESYITGIAGAAPDTIKPSDEGTEAHARLIRASLDQLDLDEKDLALLTGESVPVDSDDITAGLSVLAVVDHPNVGKSTLANCILGRRGVIMQNTPSVIRDRVSYPVRWAGRDSTLVGTSGWEIDVKGSNHPIAE